MRLRLMILALLGAVGAAAAALWLPQTVKRAAAPLTIAIPTQMSSGAVFIAHQRGYFSRRDLALTLRQFTLGKQALQAVLDNQADLALVADVPFMLAVNRGAPIAAVATVFASRTTMAVLGRRDRGINDLDDLKGKRVGTVPGTNAQYFLDKLLATRAIASSTVAIIPLAPEQFAATLRTDAVDAITVWNPLLSKLEAEHGATVVRLMASDIFVYRFVLVGKKSFLLAHADRVERALAALGDAVAEIHARPAQAQADIAGAIALTPAQLSSSFRAGDFALALDQSLLLSLEDQTRWAINRGLVSARDVPNYLDAIDQTGLLAVQPSAVKIIR